MLSPCEKALRECATRVRLQVGDAGDGSRVGCPLTPPAVKSSRKTLLGLGLAAYPCDIRIVVSVIYPVYLALIAFSTIRFWRRLQSLMLPDSYLRAWRIARTLKIVTVTSLFAYFVAISD